MTPTNEERRKLEEMVTKWKARNIPYADWNGMLREAFMAGAQAIASLRSEEDEYSRSTEDRVRAMKAVAAGPLPEHIVKALTENPFENILARSEPRRIPCPDNKPGCLVLHYEASPKKDPERCKHDVHGEDCVTCFPQQDDEADAEAWFDSLDEYTGSKRHAVMTFLAGRKSCACRNK